MVLHYYHKEKQLLLLLIYFSVRRSPTTRSPLLTDVSGTKSLHLELMLIKTGGGGGGGWGGGGVGGAKRSHRMATPESVQRNN